MEAKGNSLLVLWKKNIDRQINLKQTEQKESGRKEDITLYPTGIKQVIRKSNKQFQIHKFYNLDETKKFLEKHKLTKLIQDERDYSKSPLLIKEIIFKFF